MTTALIAAALIAAYYLAMFVQRKIYAKHAAKTENPVTPDLFDEAVSLTPIMKCKVDWDGPTDVEAKFLKDDSVLLRRSGNTENLLSVSGQEFQNMLLTY